MQALKTADHIVQHETETETEKQRNKEQIQLEGTLEAVVVLKIAALDTLLQINVNKQPDLSKKVKTLNWSHFIIFRRTVKSDERSWGVCVCVWQFRVLTFMF